VLDVGANLGIYTLLAAKRGARVFAVEADPANAAALRHHVELNGFTDRVTVFEMAATESAKTIAFYRNPRNTGGSNLFRGQPAGTVEGKTLDSLNLPPIDICKMDIEGSELMALAGMQKTLERSSRLRLLVEHSTEFGNSEALLAYLRANFSKVEVVGATGGEIPPLCNLLATR
jgi:FkbM family methyltransferase